MSNYKAKTIELIKSEIIKKYIITNFTNKKYKKWNCKTFFDDFVKDFANDSKKYPSTFNSIIINLYKELEKHLDVEFTVSKIRGVLRNFVPVTNKTIKAVTKEKKLEVPLERALSKANKWHCQFNCLSGYPNGKYKRASIDLVVGKKDDEEGYLIELKQWDWTGGHPFYAIIEIIVHFFCFIIVRAKEPTKFPGWKKFHLLIMAPNSYFPNEYLNHNISEMIKFFSNSLKELKSMHKLNCDNCDIGIHKIPINLEDFLRLVKSNKNAFIKKDAELKTKDRDRLKIILQ